MKISKFIRNYAAGCCMLGGFFFSLSSSAAAFAQEAKNIDEKSAQEQLVVIGLSSPDENAKQETGEGNNFYKKFVQGKLQVGTRVVYRVLTDSDSGNRGGSYGSGTYLGTIYALDEKQSYVPDKLFLTYFFSKHFGLELAYDSIETETMATSGTWETLKTDGDAMLSGPTLSLLARLPNNTATPYVGIGVGFLNGDFDEDASWASEYWYDGTVLRERVMIVDSVTALLLTAGATRNLDKNWFLDCSVQYVQADPDVTFQGFLNGINDNVNQTGHFPMSNVAFRLGIGYTF
jgi:outer membrane protein W